MNFLVVVIIGAVLGVLDGVGIFFEPQGAIQMADPFCGHVEGRTGCTSYRLFLSCNYSMVVRDGHWRTLRTSLQSRDLSCKGRSEIGRRTIRDFEWDHHGGTDRPLHSHVGGQKRSNQSMKPTAPDAMTTSAFATPPCRGLSLSR